MGDKQPAAKTRRLMESTISSDPEDDPNCSFSDPEDDPNGPYSDPEDDPNGSNSPPLLRGPREVVRVLPPPRSETISLTEFYEILARFDRLEFKIDKLLEIMESRRMIVPPPQNRRVSKPIQLFKPFPDNERY
ncbi:uncharacterized protein LOC110831727 [Zootermopsis nevadensis]|uniref:uncharacterized protein LOC110831727 n=1 Tax=Zootermopsis nevadensis TaxID=136037 RepID=UPI000B8E99A1|nr:uncharacterized protein LOC110831727 [Zootermopsis nevadensis]